MDYTVKTKNGVLCGQKTDICIQFLGVPYAKPPVGQLRFRKPQPLDPWDGVLEAKQYGDYCVQPGNGDAAPGVKGSENCLHLNIYTPACDEKKRPVVVWIHGGAYLTGSNSNATKFGGYMCQTADIVVVAIQYRLGAFGCVDFASLSGANGKFDTNCGTWDQVAAVNWVIENIADFGGDPECITLLGESAGACSVLTLMTTPYLKGKIKRAMLDSPAPHLMNTAENGYIAALDVVKRLGLTEEEAWKLADLPADVLTKAVEESEYDFVNHHPYLLPTAPVVDGDLIPELPYDAVMHGAADGIEVLIGTTKDEGTMFATGTDRGIFPGNLVQMEKFFQDHPYVNRDAVMALYTDLNPKKTYQEIGKELFFHFPSLEIADHLAKHGNVYVHHFEYVFPMLKLLGMGAVHCTNSTLTFGGKPDGMLKILGMFSGRNGRQITSLIHKCWCNFIACGNPNGTGEELWPAYGEEKNTYFIDKVCHVEKAPFEKERETYGIVRPYGN